MSRWAKACCCEIGSSSGGGEKLRSAPFGHGALVQRLHSHCVLLKRWSVLTLRAARRMNMGRKVEWETAFSEEVSCDLLLWRLRTHLQLDGVNLGGLRDRAGQGSGHG